MTLSLRDARTFWILQIGGWTAFGLLHTLAELGEGPVHLTLLVNATVAATGFAASLLLWAVYRRYPRVGLGTIPLAVVGSCAGALVWHAGDRLCHWLAELVMGTAPWMLVTGGLLKYLLMTRTAFLMAWSALYFGLVHARQLDLERQRALESQSLAREAQLQALRYQLSPHFLYNVLNAISALVAEGESSKAGAMIARLAEFLRATLEDQSPEVTLERELTLVDRYLEIERARFGTRLRVSIEADPDVMDACVPTLLLQPLVENAVRHGVSQQPDSGEIAVLAERRANRLSITVRDSGPGWSAARPQLGIGLRNARERLAHVFGGDSTLELGTGPDGGAEIHIDVPLRRPARLTGDHGSSSRAGPASSVLSRGGRLVQ